MESNITLFVGNNLPTERT